MPDEGDGSLHNASGSGVLDFRALLLHDDHIRQILVQAREGLSGVAGLEGAVAEAQEAIGVVPERRVVESDGADEVGDAPPSLDTWGNPVERRD